MFNPVRGWVLKPSPPGYSPGSTRPHPGLFIFKYFRTCLYLDHNAHNRAVDMHGFAVANQNVVPCRTSQCLCLNFNAHNGTVMIT